MRFIALITLLAVASGCGGGSEEGDAESATAKHHSLYIADATALPECSAEAEGWLVYLKAESKFMACSSGVWEEVAIKAQSSSSSPPPAAPIVGDPAAVKLKKGLSKEDVVRILGNPDAVDFEGTRWTYSDPSICHLDMYGKCFVSFDKEGLLGDLDEVKGERIDVLAF